MLRAHKPNAHLNVREIGRDCGLITADQKLLDRAIDRLGLSARAYHRILRVARTIADLDHQDLIQTPHLSEALGFRKLDRVVALEAEPEAGRKKQPDCQ